MVIFHITQRKDWDDAQIIGSYRADSLSTHGFIHCSTREQYIRVANARFHGKAELVLLLIDPEKVNQEICYENLEGGTALFPHIYGPLNIDAVVKVLEFQPLENGDFIEPDLFN
jgi:uncharacterized protein (DUF952 family)